MPFVLDASLALTWCFEDETTEASERVLDRLRADRAIVPSIWPLEVANSLALAERRQRITRARADQEIRRLLILPIEVAMIDTATAWHAVLPLARDHGLTAYDASYLELALRSGLALATLDRRLIAAAAQLGIPLVADEQSS
ncbi:MAG TPA: type II toxin-antitoxin system VapC family toxin [Thermomicrobiaceae bacterium]|nr:type II toxin-antitoxin system VapC family toxin [Thermomicrobiaceae bacterium]